MLEINLNGCTNYSEVSYMNAKKVKEYNDKYSHIPKDYYERFLYLLDKIKLSDKDLDKVRASIKRFLKIRWETIDLVVWFFPSATPRARLSGRTGVFYVKGAKFHSDIFRDFMEKEKLEYGVITTPCKLLIDLYVDIPENMGKVDKVLAELKFIRPMGKPDWDNAGKTYSDMIQKTLLLEDSLICEGTTRKFYSIKPRIEIRLEFMTKYDSKFNKRKIENWKTYEIAEENILEKDSIV